MAALSADLTQLKAYPTFNAAVHDVYKYVNQGLASIRNNKIKNDRHYVGVHTTTTDDQCCTASHQVPGNRYQGM